MKQVSFPIAPHPTRHTGATRRAVGLAGLAGVTAPLLAACGGTTGAPAETARLDAKQQYRITYWTYGTTQEVVERERRIIAAFRQKTPNVDVEPTVITEGYLEKTVAAFAGGTPPDASNLDMTDAQGWGARGGLVDLKTLLRGEKTLSAIYEPAAAKQALDTMTYADQVLGLPSEQGPNVVFYNADLFRNLGLKTPTELWKADQWTWEAFTDATTRLVKRGADRLWDVAGADTGQARLWMNTNGAREYDDPKAPKKAFYDEPASIAALTLLQDLRHKQKTVPLDFNRELGETSTNAFAGGRLAMIARWVSGVATFKRITEFKWGMVPYPKKQGYAYDFATSGRSISKGAQQQPAWEYLKFRETEGMLEHAQDGAAVYFYPDARKRAQEVHRGIATLESPTAMFDLAENARLGYVRLISRDAAKINSTYVNPELGKIWSNAEAVPAVAKRLTDAVNDFLKNTPQ